MDFSKGPILSLPLACEHYRLPGGYYIEANRQAKQWIMQHKAAEFQVLVEQARAEANVDIRRAILWRLADRLSCRNPLKLALQTEARCQ
jgi:hypothetical protein